ncbi:MAG: ECF transporter S component [Candidatus Marinimicrobia bacterium]|nr:ECF transporter S component [Candidatus Neomarinimicrobiota bacterium]
MTDKYLPDVPDGLRELVRAAMFSAMAIGAGYALVIVPNIELITMIVFISGLALGSRWGMIVGGVSEFIFSAMNPVGSGLMFPPLLIAQVLSMIIIGGFGGLLKPYFWKKKFSIERTIWVGITGLFLTFIFDTLTSLNYPISAGYEWRETLGMYLSGMIFLFIHHISNTFVFLIGVPLVVQKLHPGNE